MVLAELGTKITSALSKLQKADQLDEKLIKDILKDIGLALLQADVNVKYCKKLQDNILMKFKLQKDEGRNIKNIIQQEVVNELTNLLDCPKEPYKAKKGKPNIIMFVGLQGSGKTTTCTKFAYYWKKKGWRTALVCADTFRAGALDQLKQNAAKVRVPFYGNYTETDPVAIAEEGVEHFKKEGYEMIIVDTSGRHKQESELFEEMKQVEAVVEPNEIIFVMDSSIGQACFDQASAFKKAVNVGSVIITKLDGHAKGGGALSAVSATESPITFIGVGEHFNDLEEFDANSFIKRLLGMGDLKKLFHTVKEAVSIEDQEKMLEKLTSGHFCLRDMQSQFHSILKLGSINNFMSMIPGMGQNLLSKGNEKESIERIKRFLYMLDSLTSQELDGKDKNGKKIEMSESRVRRIARGSGTDIEEVMELLDTYKKFAKLVGNLGKSGLGKSNDLLNMSRNPAQMMKKMQGVIDPKMASQFGGMGNLMNMMKDFQGMEGMGGMGGMGDMMKQFGGAFGGKKKR